MESTQTILSQNILRLRKQRGMTQVALAERLGITSQAISKWESGRSAPDIALLPLLASVLECSIDTLFSSIMIP